LGGGGDKGAGGGGGAGGGNGGDGGAEQSYTRASFLMQRAGSMGSSLHISSFPEYALNVVKRCP
jgi:hypothetical protein